MRALLRKTETEGVLVGLTIHHVCSSWIAKLYADAGADFVFLENEHMLFNGANLAEFILACRLCGLPVVAKIPYVNRGAVTKLLDAGVTGIQLPMTETASQIAEVVRYTKFPPWGVRAASPGTGNTLYRDVDCASWLKESDQETAVIAHIETVEGLNRVDEILEVPGVDVMFVGMFDLSVSLGCPGQYRDPRLLDAIDRLVKASVRHAKTAGIWVPDYELAKPWIERGVRFFETQGEVGFIAEGAARLVSCFAGRRLRENPGMRHI
ncbi:MAG: HpcH/HpaI aldolase/citrate lyase family protein [Acidobacteriota bacterium]